MTTVRGSSLALLSRLWLREPDARTLDECREVPLLAPHVGDPAALAAAYADLFLLNVYPYGSAFTDPSGELGGPSAAWAARRYEQAGYRPPELLEVGAPDHVGLCLGFLDHLSTRGERDVEFPAFVLEWVPVACLAVEREPSVPPFYRAVAAATRERLMEEEVPVIAPLPESADREEEEEIGLWEVVRFLLAPARSGIFLSRSKLGHLAKAAGMRLPFGSRFDVARTLFQTAGEDEKVGAVLDRLGEELTAWESEYRRWAVAHPRWVPASTRWLNRTGETRRRLVEMQAILENPPELEYAEGS
jgi:TorA maturation chaperone TorD